MLERFLNGDLFNNNGRALADELHRAQRRGQDKFKAIANGAMESLEARNRRAQDAEQRRIEGEKFDEPSVHSAHDALATARIAIDGIDTGLLEQQLVETYRSFQEAWQQADAAKLIELCAPGLGTRLSNQVTNQPDPNQRTHVVGAHFATAEIAGSSWDDGNIAIKAWLYIEGDVTDLGDTRTIRWRETWDLVGTTQQATASTCDNCGAPRNFISAACEFCGARNRVAGSWKIKKITTGR